MSGIQMNLMGGGTVVVALSDHLVFGSTITPLTAVAQFRLRQNGQAQKDEGGGFTLLETFVNPPAATPNYECRATLNSGSLTSGTIGSWEAITTPRTWSLTRSLVGDEQAQILIEIRAIGGSTVLDSATIDLAVEVSM